MPASETDRSTLTPDDLDLLALLAEGRSRAQLSSALDVNPRTVQRRIERIRGHFRVETTVEAVVAAVRQELI